MYNMGALNPPIEQLYVRERERERGLILALLNRAGVPFLAFAIIFLFLTKIRSCAHTKKKNKLKINIPTPQASTLKMKKD